MKTFQANLRQWLLFAFAIVGAGIAIYLTTVHYEKVPLLCSTSGPIDCERVTSSSYSLVPGTTIPITIPGLAWCIALAALALLAIRSSQRWIRTAELVWTILGMLSVFYLVYAEVVVLHSICLWCTILHVTIFAALIVAIIEFNFSRQEQVEEPEEENALVTR
jgi:uncharacterized membrane protein